MREPWRAVDITDGIDAGKVCFVTVTDLDVAAVGQFGRHTAGKDWLDADRDEADIGGDHALFLRSLDGDFHAVAEILGGSDLGVY